MKKAARIRALEARVAELEAAIALRPIQPLYAQPEYPYLPSSPWQAPNFPNVWCATDAPALSEFQINGTSPVKHA